MMVNLFKEPDDLGAPHECCCLCGKPTAYWYFPHDDGFAPNTQGDEVACCRDCAARAMPADMPSKQSWCDREYRRIQKAQGAA